VAFWRVYTGDRISEVVLSSGRVGSGRVEPAVCWVSDPTHMILLGRANLFWRSGLHGAEF